MLGNKFEAQAIIRTATGGMTPSKGSLLVFDDDWRFRRIVVADIMDFPDVALTGDVGAVQAELDAHEAATLSVHGIADTSQLIITTDIRLSNARVPTAHAASHSAAGSDQISVVNLAGNFPGARITGTVPDSTLLAGNASSYYLDRGNHTGTQLAGTISNFAAAVAATPPAAHAINTAGGLHSGTLDKAQQHAQTAYYDGAGPYTVDIAVTRTGINAMLTLTRTGGAGLQLQSQAASTSIQTVGSFPLNLGTAGSNRWQITSTGHLLAVVDASFDIGASGATRPRDIWISRNISVANQLISAVVTGTAPIVVASTTIVANLNSSLLNGQNSAYYLALANATGILTTAKGGSGADGSALAAGQFLASPSGGSGSAGYRIISAVDLPTHSHAWADVSKISSSLADLATRSAGALNSGTLLVARLPADAALYSQLAVAVTLGDVTMTGNFEGEGGHFASDVVFDGGIIGSSTMTLGLFGHTAHTQFAAVTAPTGGVVIDIQARAAIVSILAVLSGYGLTT